jgi:hypothetical protein
MTDFSDAPISLSAARADRSGLAKDMSARDMLVELIRDIDTGKIMAPDFAVVCLAKRNPDGAVFTTERVGGKQNPLEVYGLMWRSMLKICDDTR